MTGPDIKPQPAATDLDLARLAEWLHEALGSDPSPLSSRLIVGGRSNLTYEISSGTQKWILRRPPLGHVLGTAHDMSRECDVMAALAGTSVPVPMVHASCADPTVLGAPFYVMESVAGTPYRHASELDPLGPDRVRAISLHMVDALVALHDVDINATGLAKFGRPRGFLARQLHRWSTQLERSRSRELPGAVELHTRLAADVPTQTAPGLVHGDYRLDNLLIDNHDHVAAIIDWEMATIGDPITDLGLLVAYQRLSREAGGEIIADAPRAAGFVSENELTTRYLAASTRRPCRFGFYVGLAAYKLLSVAEGIHYRYLQGETAGVGFNEIGSLASLLVDIGLTALKEDD